MEIIKEINSNITLPSLEQIFIPFIEKGEKCNTKRANFGAAQLSEGTIGLFFLNLSEEAYHSFFRLDFSEYLEMSAFDVSKSYNSKDLIKRSIGLGIINAISQYIFKKSKYDFNYTLDALGLLNIQSKDRIGMVGYFHPLLKRIKNIGAELIIIEKKKKFLMKNSNFVVTLDKSKLEDCNKVLCTSTTLLNETLEEILYHCKNAEKISLIGPTAGFLPDPVFNLGVDVIGGLNVSDSSLFVDLFKNRINWNPACKKYCIIREKYPGFNSLLRKITEKSN